MLLATRTYVCTTIAQVHIALAALTLLQLVLTSNKIVKLRLDSSSCWSCLLPLLFGIGRAKMELCV